MSKFLQKPWEAKWVETLHLSKQIMTNTMTLVKLETELTLAHTFTKPTMRSVFKGTNGQLGFSVVHVLVTRFINAFAFSTKLNDTQLETLTIDTLEHFAYESLEDVILFFKMARSGKFGVTKRGVDANLIFGEWMPQYLSAKAELREQTYTQQKSSFTAHTTTMEDVQKAYEAQAQKKKQQDVAVYIDKLTKPMDRHMLEETIFYWQRTPELQPYVAMLKRKRRSIP